MAICSVKMLSPLCVLYVSVIYMITVYCLRILYVTLDNSI